MNIYLSTTISENNFLRAILDSLPLALFCKNYTEERGVFIAWNTTAERLWGLSKDEIIGASDFDFFPQEQALSFQKKDKEVLSSQKEVFIKEEAVDSPTVGRRIVQTWKVPLNDRYLLGISQDITEKKKLEAELSKQRSISIQAAKMASLGEMAGSIAHEINNPLAIILSAAQILEIQSQNMHDEKSVRLSKVISETVERISNITYNLLKFSRTEDNPPPTVHSFNAIIEDTLGLCTERLKGELIDFIVHNNTNVLIKCNPIEIVQVLVNTLNNAVDALRNTSSPKIHLDVQLHNRNLQVRIIDTGIGINQETNQRLFEPFFTTKKAGEGTGLGMSLSRRIIENHRGTIIFERLQNPTICLITLPILYAHETSS